MAKYASDKKRIYITEARRRVYEGDARTIQFYRNNPVLAAKDLLGINLTDAQKYILQNTWVSTHAAWACCRNFGKSFIASVFMVLKAILFPDQSIYIISSVGDQAKETFTKIEEIALRMGRTSASIKSLKDILIGETVKNPTNKTGFSHPVGGYEVNFYNGSAIYTLNSKPDNARSRRATLVFVDEAAFCAPDLLAVTAAFAAQEMDFVTSVADDFDPELIPRQCPTQIVYASSQDTTDTVFYKYYKDYAKRMVAGDISYFVCDMNCEVGIQTYMDGKPYAAIISRSVVESEMASNKDKALREYYNRPSADTSESQIIKWANIRSSEKFSLPIMSWIPQSKFVLAFDPARTVDNSILSVMNLVEDPELGLCGDIVNCVNFIDRATRGKYKLNSNAQLDEIRKLILLYNGPYPDYEYIDSLIIDAGAGGSGMSTYADGLLNEWTDSYGKKHHGLIDKSHDVYKTLIAKYPDAIDRLKLVNPRGMRTQMFEELIELMQLGVIRFPYEYNNQDFIRISDGQDPATGEEKYHSYEVSIDEAAALASIDIMKAEITSIHRYKNAENTSVSYALAKEKENRMHDDRAYTLALLAHRLYELRRARAMSIQSSNSEDLNSLFSFRAPKTKKTGGGFIA